MPIRPELRPLYPPHWRELSSHVRFERAQGRCQRCGRPHLVLLRCLPDGRWFDERAATWRDRRGRLARWPDLMETARFRMTRVVLAAAHLDSDPTNNRLKNPRALSTLPHAARSAAPFGAALDHLPPALGSRRSLPRSVPGLDRRAGSSRQAGRRPLVFEQSSYSLLDRLSPAWMSLSDRRIVKSAPGASTRRSY